MLTSSLCGLHTLKKSSGLIFDAATPLVNDFPSLSSRADNL